MISRLEALVAVHRSGGVGEAARSLYVSQPALTARLQRLEAEVGAPLLERRGRGVGLTAAGLEFVVHAERALVAVEAGRETVAALARGDLGRLSVGSAPAVGTYVPAVIQRYAGEHPGVRVQVRTGHSEDILTTVLAGEVDVGLVRELRHPDVETQLFYHDELVLVVPPDHPFADEGRVRVEQLGGEPLILFDRFSSYRELTQALVRSAGVVPREVLEVDNIEATKRMVMVGLGVAVLPVRAVVDEVMAGRLAAAAIVGAQLGSRQVVAIRRRGVEPTPAVAAFLGLLDQIAPHGHIGDVRASDLTG